MFGRFPSAMVSEPSSFYGAEQTPQQDRFLFLKEYDEGASPIDCYSCAPPRKYNVFHKTIL